MKLRLDISIFILAAYLLCGYLPLSWGQATKQVESDNKAPAEAIFAGGCFWCTESDFEKVPGVLYAVSGYIDGEVAKPNYKQVSAGTTGHTEAVKIGFDPSVVSYETLLKVFWYSIDPLVKDAQFCDQGSQYRSGIYYLDEKQKVVAQASLEPIKKMLTGKIYTEIKPASKFWVAENYHQDYYKKNPLRYKYYRYRCGRDARLETLWGDNAGWMP